MAAELFFLPFPTAFNSNGLAIPGAKLQFLVTGTTTPADVYTTVALNVAHANPVVANGAGRFPKIYLDGSVTYRLRIYDKDDVLLDDVDPYQPGVSTATITAASGVSVSTRSALAAIANPAVRQSATLTESGREGLFIFVDSDLSDEVSADSLQGIYVAPSSDTTGASGAWVRVHQGVANPEWFGLSASAGQLANVTAVNTAIETCLDVGIREMKFPAKVYPMGYGSEFPANSVDVGFGTDGGVAYAQWNGIYIQSGPFVLDLTGAKLTGYHVRITIAEAASFVKVIGGHLICTVGSYQGTTSSNGTLLTSSNLRSTYLFNLYGSDIDIEGTTFEKDDPLAGGYMGYIRAAARRVRMSKGYKFRGGNGTFISGQGHRFSDFDLESETDFGDDCFAVKAAEANPSTGAIITKDIIIGHGRVKNYAAIIAIGSEVGRPGSIGNDSTFSNRVQNVLVHDVVAEQVAYAALIKPGSISSINYRDGIIEDVQIRDITLNDISGIRFRKPVYFVASRGMIVRRVTCKGIQVNARAFDNGASGVTCGAVHFWHLDYTGDTDWSSGSTSEGAASGEPTFQDIEVEVKYNDPYNGAANSASAPGYPVQSIVRAENQTVAYGVMERITVDVEANGCKERAIYIADGLDDAITIRRAKLRNVCVAATSSSATQGGLVSSSNIAVERFEVSALGGGYPVGGTDSSTYNSTAYKGAQRAVVPIGTYAAGTAADKTVWVTPNKTCYIHKVEWIDSAGVAIDATNYTTLRLIPGTGSSSLVSTATNATALTADTKVQGHTDPSIRTADALNIAANTAIRFTKTESGTGAGVTDLVCVIHYIEHGA